MLFAPGSVPKGHTEGIVIVYECPTKIVSAISDSLCPYSIGPVLRTLLTESPCVGERALRAEHRGKGTCGGYRHRHGPGLPGRVLLPRMSESKRVHALYPLLHDVYRGTSLIRPRTPARTLQPNAAPREPGTHGHALYVSERETCATRGVASL